MCQICATFAPQFPACSYEGLPTVSSDGSGPLGLPGETSLEDGDAGAGTGTNAGIGAGEFFLGELSSNADSDWIEITLDAGTYTIAAVGVGALDDALNDPLLRLRDASGNHDDNDSSTTNDDGAPGFNAQLSVTVSATTTFYIDVQSYDNSDSGTYGVSVTEGSVASYNDEMIAGNLLRPGQAWTTAAGTGGQEVTWAFRTNGTPYDNPGTSSPFDGTPLEQMDTNQRLLTQGALEYLEDISGLNFTQVNPGGTSDNATMLFGAYTANDGAGAFAYFPGSTAGGIRTTSSAAGDVWINNNSAGNSYDFGSYNLYTMLHEIGHAIGLAHPGDYNAGNGGPISYGNSAGFIQDSTQYTVMSYFDETNTGASSGLSFPDTFMLHDFMAIHALYGADVSYNAGNTVYGFNATEANSVYDFTENQNPFMTVYDGQGTDTIDLSGYAMAQNLTLEEGIFSNIGGYVGNFSIAFGAVIENAIGGSGDDEITGNAAANDLSGGGGEDTLNGGAGNDSINGGNDDDEIAGGAGDDELVGGAGADDFDGGTHTAGIGDRVLYVNSNAAVAVNLLSGAATGGHATGDTFTDIENLTGSVFEDTLTGDDNNNEINGFNGNDLLDGGDGNDTLLGGQGDDTLIAGEGADFMNGGTGNGDVSDYSGSGSAVTVQLNVTGTIGGGYATGDTVWTEDIIGSDYSDLINGNSLSNELIVGDGDDGVNAASGDDIIYGGSGDDFIIGSRGADIIDGGSNSAVGDTASYSNSDARVVVDLDLGTATGSGHGTGDTLINIENIFGSAFNDDIYGDGNANILDGFNGVDELFGRDGNDTLNGGGNVDYLNGGAGDDVLSGNSGYDRFIFDIFDFGNDTITDFTNNQELLDMRDSGFAFSDMTISQSGGDTVVTVAGTSSSITLEGVTSLINADDFIF